MTTDPNTAVTEEMIERKAKNLADEARDPNWWSYIDKARTALLAMKSSAPQQTGLTDVERDRRFAELRHWFFQKLNPEQRMGFLFAAGVAPRACDFTFGMQHKAIEHVAALLVSNRGGVEVLRDALAEARDALQTVINCEYDAFYMGVRSAVEKIDAALDTPTSDKGEG